MARAVRQGREERRGAMAGEGRREGRRSRRSKQGRDASHAERERERETLPMPSTEEEQPGGLKELDYL